MYDPDGYGDYGMGHPRNGGTFNRTHYVRFLASRRMGSEEPSPQEVIAEIKKVIHQYKTTRNKPRKYSICISPGEVLIRELETYHDEAIQTKYIHYCVHDEDFPNIFVFIAWSQSQSCFLAHTFYCRDVAEAANLKADFASGFQAAFKEWKAENRPAPRRQQREAYSEYGPPRLTRGALDRHRQSYEAPAVMEREHYRPPPRVASRPRPRQRPAPGPRPNQTIEVYGNPRQGGYVYDDDDDFLADVPPPPRPAVEKEVVYTRETFPPPAFGNDVYERRNGMRGGPAYDDGMYGTRGGLYGDRGDRGRRSRRYVDDGYARDDMLF